MHLIFEQIATGGDRNFAYLIGDNRSKEAVIIDPSYQPEKIVQRAVDQGLSVSYILNTHGHGDHTNGNSVAKELTLAPIAVYKDSFVPSDIKLENEQILSVGSLKLKILYTPGHCEDHIVIFVQDYDIAITGDHLFIGKIGGTESDEHAHLQYNSLQRLFDELPLHTTVWPGHDVGCRPSSTLALEKVSNPFLMVGGFQEFIDLKTNWASFKRDHGLI